MLERLLLSMDSAFLTSSGFEYDTTSVLNACCHFKLDGDSLNPIAAASGTSIRL